MEECAENFREAVVAQGYGMTEACGIHSLENEYVCRRHRGSAGSLLHGVEAQIVGADKLKPLPPGELREIWVHGHES